MFAEEEFNRWLRRPNKTFVENLQFAIKAWQAVEFQETTKYQLILIWVSDEIGKFKSQQQLPLLEFNELFSLRAQPGLVAQNVKEDFVQNLLKLKPVKSQELRAYCELFQKLNNFELLQDLFRSNYQVHAQLYSVIFVQYANYLNYYNSSNPKSDSFVLPNETDFFAKLIDELKETAKRVGGRQKFREFYTELTLQPLIESILQLRLQSVNFFNELVDVESILCDELTEDELFDRVLAQPLHVAFSILECAILRRRTVELFVHSLLRRVFDNFLLQISETNPDEALSVAAYTLELLRKHDIGLLIKMQSGKSALTFLGEQLFPLMQKCKQSHLSKVLMVLCAALRLNPLIFEKHIFQLTIWMMVAKKDGGAEEMKLFESFLELLMDMFRRLSRTEKFVGNLLKLLKEWLQKYNVTFTTSKKKRKSNTDDIESPPKKVKIQENIGTPEPTQKCPTTVDYVNVLLQDFNRITTETLVEDRELLPETNSFPHLQSAWPTGSVGVAFSKLITGLISKPSIVVSKALLFSFKEELATLQEQSTELSDNTLFLLDLHVALLCSYFEGSKLVEQSEKFFDELGKQYELTVDVLSIFGQFVLSREHHRRIMSAFLELSYHVANFHLLLIYYKPDCLQEAPIVLPKHLHGHLTLEEWSLIKQRVINFGKSNCKHLLDRLLLQRLYARYLLDGGDDIAPDNMNLSEMLLGSPFAQKDGFEIDLQGSNVLWLLSKLNRDEKIRIASVYCNNSNLNIFVDDMEMLELLGLATYEKLHTAFSQSGRNSLLAQLHFDFEAFRQYTETNEDIDKTIASLVNALNERSSSTAEVTVPLDAAKQAINTLKQLPIGHLRRKYKCVIFVLHLAFYHDLKFSEAAEYVEVSFGILTDLLHFGESFPLCKYFSSATLLQLLPVKVCSEFYKLLFSNVKRDEKGVTSFLKSFIELLQRAASENELSNDLMQMAYIAIEPLANLSGPIAKRMLPHLNEMLQVYGTYVRAYFSECHEGNSKKDKKFVEKTLVGFVPYSNYILSKSIKARKTDVDCNETEHALIDDDFRRICKIYLAHSIDYSNPHAVQLLRMALTHRKQLHLDQDEIELVLSKLWQQLQAQLSTQDELDLKPIEAAMKIIIDYKTNEDILLTLKEIKAAAKKQEDSVNISRLLTLIANCPFSTIKGAIFNEQFKYITYDLEMHLVRDERQQYVHHKSVLSLLTCQKALVDNKKVPISLDTLDNILSFISHINMKKFETTDLNADKFFALHLAVTELCLSLIKHRHVLLLDRVPQFTHIFKDLLQAVVWYKCNRHKDTQLNTAELDRLAELALKLEALMHIIATHGLAVKRVAPFLLTFVIHLMVSNTRPTTLYSKIKTPIQSICFDLIRICDHRVKGFILRCSNEAARQVYELLVKDYQKYHKFKGKV